MSPLQEVSHNQVVIPLISSLYQSFKSPKSKSVSHIKGFKTTFNSLHSAVIALCDYNDTAYTVIEVKTDVKERTASAIVQHAKEASIDSHNINELLENESAEKESKHSMIVESSAAFIEFKEAMISKEKMYKPWPQVAKDHDYLMTQSTIEKVVKEHQDSEHNYRIK